MAQAFAFRTLLPSSVPVGSQVPVELRLALSLIITTHPHPRDSRDPACNWPPNPGQVYFKFEIDQVYLVEINWMASV